MKPIKFKDSNTEFGVSQDQYGNLHALKIKGDAGHVVTCWKLNFFERLQVLISGRVWLMLSTFNTPLQPSYVSAFRRSVYKLPTDWRFYSDFIRNKLTLN